MAKVVICQNCKGNGKIHKEVKPGKWEWQTCLACNGTGKVDKRLI